MQPQVRLRRGPDGRVAQTWTASPPPPSPPPPEEPPSSFTAVLFFLLLVISFSLKWTILFLIYFFSPHFHIYFFFASSFLLRLILFRLLLIFISLLRSSPLSHFIANFLSSRILLSLVSSRIFPDSYYHFFIPFYSSSFPLFSNHLIISILSSSTFSQFLPCQPSNNLSSTLPPRHNQWLPTITNPSFSPPFLR